VMDRLLELGVMRIPEGEDWGLDDYEEGEW
jgi:hypothetical protein